jgi:glycosyltransferase involved in cell wall biosynthesis
VRLPATRTDPPATAAAPAAPPGILFIVNSLGVGGAERQVLTLLNHLDTRRFRLHLAYLKRDERLLPLLERARLDEVLCCEVRRRIDWAAVRRLRALLAARRIDALVCTNPYSMLYGALAREAGSSVRLATVFHSTTLATLKERAQMLYYRRLFRRCDLVVYVCHSQRRYWRAHGLRPLADEVIYNGIDTHWYSDTRPGDEQRAFRRALGLEDGDFVVGLCSALRAEKAHGDLLLALAKLRSQGAPAKGLLIGDGSERAAIERRILRLGLEGHVRITGHAPDVRPYIRACDVMTLVSHRVETFSLAALESMSLGKPLVMSDLGGAGEQIVHGRHGFLFDPGDIDSLAARLSALSSPALREKLGAAAASRVRERFTVAAMAAGFTASIEALVGEGRARRSLQA